MIPEFPAIQLTPNILRRRLTKLGFTAKENQSENMSKCVADFKFLKIIKTEKGFFFAERKGIDSIGIFLYRKRGMIRKQPLPLDNVNQTLYECPITGTIDERHTPLQSAIIEALEEGGYTITEGETVLLCKYIVGTQTNEQVYLFCADSKT